MCVSSQRASIGAAFPQMRERRGASAVLHRPHEGIHEIIQRPRGVAKHMELLGGLRQMRRQRHRERLRARVREMIEIQRGGVRRVRIQPKAVERVGPMLEKR